VNGRVDVRVGRQSGAPGGRGTAVAERPSSASAVELPTGIVYTQPDE
jgi:hypothetical protein